MRTPLGRVRGLGPAHSGTGHFLLQRMTAIANVALVIYFVFLIVSLSGRSHATVATALGQIPFTSPVTMPMRMASTQVPPLEVVISLVLLLLGIVAVAWIAGKVYRVGILSTGKRPSLSELVRWVRAA